MAITTTQTQAVKLIGKELNLKASRIKKDFKKHKASFSNLNGGLVAKGQPVGLINFGSSEKKVGVSVKVKKTGSRKTLKHAFIAIGKNNNKHIFSRDRGGLPKAKFFEVGKKSKAAWPKIGKHYQGLSGGVGYIKQHSGPRIEDIYARDDIYSKVRKIAVDAYSKNVFNETGDLLRRFG